MPHAPQLSRSLVVSTQSDPHRLPGAAQSHTPLMQEVPIGHERPQEPQLARSAIRLTQEPAQRALGPEHRDVHAPALHTRPGGQRVPQAPQFAGSVCVSTQTPAHATAFEGQTQAPLTH
jgi:hypothetical protein